MDKAKPLKELFGWVCTRLPGEEEEGEAVCCCDIGVPWSKALWHPLCTPGTAMGWKKGRQKGDEGGFPWLGDH